MHRPVGALCNPNTPKTMSIPTLLLIILVLFLIGALPSWGHSKNWGYRPAGGLGLLVVILLVLMLLGKI